MDKMNIEISAPICQIVSGKQGRYQQINITKRKLSLQQFRDLCNTSRYATPTHVNYDDLERKYWRNIKYVAPIYGADVSATLTDEDCENWNINRLGTILDYVNEDYGIKIDGVNTAYLCKNRERERGMIRNCNSINNISSIYRLWHVEDHFRVAHRGHGLIFDQLPTFWRTQNVVLGASANGQTAGGGGQFVLRS